MTDVRSQYERYPYPSRDPQEEKARLILPLSMHLKAINHCVFAGRRDWTKPVRILDAGGGTGDATIGLAQQFADLNVKADIVYIDLSATSRAIAEERANVRRLTGITFMTGSLLDLSPELVGTFDFINCSGVIHHLQDPAAGLSALAKCLRPQGGIFLMVYAPYGRAGVYPLQEMLKDTAPPTESPQERIRRSKKLISALPQQNLFNKCTNIIDHRGGDAGIFDLLLHSIDRPYSVN